MSKSASPKTKAPLGATTYDLGRDAKEFETALVAVVGGDMSQLNAGFTAGLALLDDIKDVLAGWFGTTPKMTAASMDGAELSATCERINALCAAHEPKMTAAAVGLNWDGHRVAALLAIAKQLMPFILAILPLVMTPAPETPPAA